MHLLKKFLLVLTIAILLSISVILFTKAELYDDTIVYEPAQEEIFIQPEADSTSTTTENLVEEVVEEVAEIETPKVPKEELVSETVVPVPPPAPVKEAPKEEPLSFGLINTLTREALVNIFCTTKGPHQYITPITGSGTIIDGGGVILTNAHIAQFYLFEDFPTDDFVNCVIRTGSPAKATYKAKLLYISPEWIDANASAISTENPMGTGEDDYALLLITESLNNQELPEVFPYIPYEAGSNSILREDSILVGGYAAGLLGGRTIQQDLYASTAITEAMELYTFDETGTLDLVSLGGTVVSQQGASGGPAVNEYGKMVGLISTASDGETTSDRDLRATTIEHIERSLVENNNTTLDELLSGDLNTKAVVFNETTAPTLLQVLLSSF